jgi:hypothetical protein
MTSAKNKISNAIALALLAVIAIIVVRCMQPSPYSNCIEVAVESDFVGKRLKHGAAMTAKVLKTSECEKLDQQVDNGDGKENGRVRWAVCRMGPDCDEEGMF